MRIVVIGEGKVGFTLTRELSREGHDLLVIDNRKDALVQVEERLDVMVLDGNGASVKVQQAAEVGKCDLMIAVTSADETNLLCCMVARKAGLPPHHRSHPQPGLRRGNLSFAGRTGIKYDGEPGTHHRQGNFRSAAIPVFPETGAFRQGPRRDRGAAGARGRQAGRHGSQ